MWHIENVIEGKVQQKKFLKEMDETMIIIFNIEFNKFKGQFICLGENTEKYITFLVSIK